jgi:hypothetical protein
MDAKTYNRKGRRKNNRGWAKHLRKYWKRLAHKQARRAR